METVGLFTIRDDGMYSDSCPLTLYDQSGTAVAAIPGQTPQWDVDDDTDPQTWALARHIARLLSANPL
jgi:hypothetical protein